MEVPVPIPRFILTLSTSVPLFDFLREREREDNGNYRVENKGTQKYEKRIEPCRVQTHIR